MEEFTKKYENMGVSELISLCRLRDDFAFSELAHRYTPMMRSVVSGFCDAPLDSDELFSEACVALHSAVMSYDLGQSGVTFGLYARICVSHRILDLIRREGKIPGFSELDVELVAADGAGDAIESRLVERETVEHLMREARHVLSDYEYRVLILHMQGYKTAAIAELLDKPSKSVDNAKARLFRRLRSTIGGAF